MELDVGRRQAGAAAHEREGLGHRAWSAGRTCAAANSARYFGCSASSSEPPPVDSKMHTQVRVVLQVLPDAVELVKDRDADLAEVIGRADAREHQQLRGAVGAGGEDDLAGRARELLGALACRGSAPRSPRVPSSSTAQHLGAGDDLEVRPLEHGLEVGVGRAPAAAVLLGDLRPGGAVLLGAVVVGRCAGCPRRLGRLEERRGQRARRARVARRSAGRRPRGARRRRARCSPPCRKYGPHVAPSPSPRRPGPPTGRSRAGGRGRRASRSSSSSRRAPLPRGM